MICCIVGLLILTTVGRLRRLVGLRTGENTVLFAPVAQRPAAGQAVFAPAAPATEPAEPAVAPRRPDPNVFGYAGTGVAVGLVAGPLLVWSGAAENTGSTADWLLRGLCYLAVIVVAAMLSRSASIWRLPRGAGPLLIVVGAVIFEIGLLDMHVFGILAMHDHAGNMPGHTHGAVHANMLADMIFHGVGPALALAGALTLGYGSTGRSTTSWRSPRSTVTSARPPAEAVTVSSRPPSTT